MKNKHYYIVKYNSIAFCILGLTIVCRLLFYPLLSDFSILSALIGLSIFGIICIGMWTMLQPIKVIEYNTESKKHILPLEGVLIFSNILLLSLI